MMHIIQCTHTCVAHLLALTQPSDDKTTRTRRCHQTCVHLLLCAHYTMCILYCGQWAHYVHHIQHIIYSMISTNDLFSDPGIVSPAMFTFDSIWSVCAQICTRPPPLKIHFLCQHQDLCIPDSEEIDPVYFEKVNLGRLGTLYSTGDRNISKQEREKQQGIIKFGIKFDLQMT